MLSASISVSLDLKDDADIILVLEGKSDPNEYIKRLIREDVDKTEGGKAAREIIKLTWAERLLKDIDKKEKGD